MTGTWAFCSVSGVSPPSEVVPKPTICSSVDGANSDSSAAPETGVGALVEARDSLMIEMS